MPSPETDSSIAQKLRQAMRRLPGPVSLITTIGEQGEPVGMVASAVIPVTLEPPAMLVSVNRSTATHRAIAHAGKFCINLLGTAHTGFVDIFADREKRAQRFQSSEWDMANGLPYLATACFNLFCKVHATQVVGTHELFVGEVKDVRGEDGAPSDPLSWVEGDFARLDRLE